MEILNIEGISFPVAKYDIVRFIRDGEPYKDSFYLPTNVKLYKYFDYNSKVQFKGITYSQQFYFGITKWSEEKEQIAQNMHWEILGEEDNYPVINSPSFKSYSLFNKYLIYVLENVAPYKGETIPLTDQFPIIPETFYVKRTKADDDVFNELMNWIENNKDADDKDKWHEKMMEINETLMKPVQYIKINGFEDGKNFDATVIDVKSIIFDKEIKSISRESYDIELLCNGEIDDRTHFKEITQEEYNNAYNKMLSKF